MANSRCALLFRLMTLLVAAAKLCIPLLRQVLPFSVLNNPRRTVFKMDNVPSSHAIVPRLKMDALRTDEDYYKVDEQSANRFIEESLLVMLANNFNKSTQSTDEGRKPLLSSFTDFGRSLDWMDDDRSQQSVLSARALLSARFSVLLLCDPTNGADSLLPPRSPRTPADQQRVSGPQLMGALAHRSKLHLLAIDRRVGGKAGTANEWAIGRNGSDSDRYGGDEQSQRRKHQQQLVPLRQHWASAQQLAANDSQPAKVSAAAAGFWPSSTTMANVRSKKEGTAAPLWLSAAEKVYRFDQQQHLKGRRREGEQHRQAEQWRREAEARNNGEVLLNRHHQRRSASPGAIAYNGRADRFAQPNGSNTAATASAVSPSINGTSGQAARTERGREGKAALPPDFEVIDFLRNYEPNDNNVLNGTSNPKFWRQRSSSSPTSLCLDRFQTLPAGRFHSQQRPHSRSPSSALSPTAQSRGLIEAAIHSLKDSNGTQQQRVHLAPRRQDSSRTSGSSRAGNSLQIKNSFLYPEEQRGSKSLQKTAPEDLLRLFEELGFDLEEEHNNSSSSMSSQTTPPTLTSSFASAKERFRQSATPSPQMFQFSTNGQQQTKQKRTGSPQRFHTMPRHSAGSLGGKSTSPANAAQNGEKNINGNNSQKRGQPQTTKSSDLSNFWLSMVKQRAEASSSSSQAQRVPLGLSAAERLQKLCDSIEEVEKQHSRPSSSQQLLYPYRRSSGVMIETVAQRRNNYLLEARRASESPRTGSPMPGSLTPSSRMTKSRSPSPSPSQFLLQNNPLASMSFTNAPRDENNKKGCGRFPTANEEEKETTTARTGKREAGTVGQEQELNNKTTVTRKKSRSPDTISEASMTSSQHSHVGRLGLGLPHPSPKHNIRDQLLSAGFPFSAAGSRQSTSFFGGNNPFAGGHRTTAAQTASGGAQFRSNSPNFPAFNMVTSRVSQFEKQDKGTLPASALAAPAPLQSSKKQNNSLTATGSGNALSPSAAHGGQLSPLSPRSSVFRTKSVIVFNFDDADPAGHQQKEQQRDKENKPQQKQKARTRKGATVADKTDTLSNNGAVAVANGNAGTGDKSPRWCAHANEDVFAAKKQQQAQKGKGVSQKGSSGHNTASISSTNGLRENGDHCSPLAYQKSATELSVAGVAKSHGAAQQPNGHIARGTAAATKQMNGAVPQMAQSREQQQQCVPSSVSAFISCSSTSPAHVARTKLPLRLDELVSPARPNEKEERKRTRTSPPKYGQQQRAKKRASEEATEDAETAYALAVRNAHICGRLAGMPRFHFPLGRPLSKADNDQVLARVRELFDAKPRGQVHLADFGELCRRINFAVYTKRAVYDACCHSNGLPILPALATSTTTGGGDSECEGLLKPADGCPIDFNQFCVYWNRMISEAHDEAARFVFTLGASRFSQQQSAGSQPRHLVKEDFLPIMMDLILTHPGLHFLKEAPQFYSRYADVVIVRIYWNVNRSWTGRITANELRRSNFLQTLHVLDDVTDINKVTDYFSYEHFYVTYCKFWELDTDHDMIISREDMRRHCNGALTDRIIERIFSAAVIRTPPEQRTAPQSRGPIKQQPIETIGFEDFVCFLLAEEDKRHPTSVEYWFRCTDLDGDGQISLYEMEYFYEAVEQKLLAKNMETLALRDVICNLLDSISPQNGHTVTRADLRRSGLAHRFFNTFVNWIKYVDQESSDGERASVKTNEDKEISDWEMFCLSEYELLMSETDQMSNEGDVDENIDVILDDDEEETSELVASEEASGKVERAQQKASGGIASAQQRQAAKAMM